MKQTIQCLVATFLVFGSVEANAILAWVSRANCGITLPLPHPSTGSYVNFNESFTWDRPFFIKRTLQTFSHHNLGGYANHAGTNWAPEFHTVNTGVERTWRSWAGDLFDSPTLDWWVHGNHWRRYRRFWGYLGWTFARDCNLGQW